MSADATIVSPRSDTAEAILLALAYLLKPIQEETLIAAIKTATAVADRDATGPPQPV